mmetsp:Transcript_10829/g.20253  ORF Transcript_10829/g.20253 Transcript_10829/m.20253 type:complete len:248 (-) Transcript_10829:1087-1830(-)
MQMRGLESIDERVFRILSKSEMTPNVEKPAIIPLIPFEGRGADQIINFMCPSESSREPYFETYRGACSDEESRSDLDSGEYEDSSQFRNGDVSMDELMELDQIRVGYHPEEIINISNDDSSHDSFGSKGIKLIKYINSFPKQRLDGNILSSEQQKSLGDIDYPTPGSKLSRSAMKTAMDELPSRSEDKSEMVKNASFDSDVSSVLSATSTIIASPNIWRLKARKRQLERFLSEKSLESRMNREVLTC